jgi:small subunit ribosomal protein S4e
MNHLIRQEIPRKWPIKKKGTVYVIRPNSSIENGIPLLIALREMLGVAQDRREVKSIIHSRYILMNEKPAKDEKNTLALLDTLRIIPMKKSYRLELSDKGKFCFREIKEEEAARKIAKLSNRKMLKGKKVQLNFSDGRNFLSDIRCEIDDSAVINLKEGKIEKILPLKEKARAIIFAGKHSGKSGEITSLNKQEKIARIKTDDGEINILVKQLMVVE